MDVFDARAEVIRRHGPVFEQHRRWLYASHHTTAGYLPQSLGARIAACPGGLESYLQLLRTMFPERAGYRHDRIEERADVPADQRDLEPINADSHLAFIAGGLHPSVSYGAERTLPVYFVDLDGGCAGRRPAHPRVVGLVPVDGAEAEPVQQLPRRGVLAVDELGAELEREPGELLVRVDPAAEAVAGLQHQHVELGVDERLGGGETRHPGAEDDHVHRL